MLIRVIRVASGILTHQGHISKVNANADSVSDSVTRITSRASCDAKNKTSTCLGLLLAEERLCEIRNFALRFQHQLQSVENGFTVIHNEGEYDFTATFVDRSFIVQL